MTANAPTPARLALLAVLSAVSVLAALALDPVAQDPAYHRFADTRALLGVPNALNVLSNLPFLVLGWVGVIACWRPTSRHIPALPAFRVFFISLALIAVGSAVYHWQPSNHTLLLDRLPMSAGFMAFFSMVLSLCVDARLGRRVLWPLVAAGVASVLYWYATELMGRGDLRPYALVQFLPLVLIAVVLATSTAPARIRITVGFVLGCYLLAKVAEVLDSMLFDTIGMVSGHTLKHLVAAVGVYGVLRLFRMVDAAVP